MTPRKGLAAFAALFLGGVAVPVLAATTTQNYANYVDLELVLAVDVSGSMDLNEQRVQREGYVQAFRDPEVQKAITSGPYGRVAITYIEWSSAFYQLIVMPWRVLGDQEDVQQFATDLENAPISREGRTSISGALLYAASAFPVSGVISDRRTIDVSGDGANNDGNTLTPVRDQLVQQGIAINGLPILVNPSPMVGGLTLDAYYQGCVIGGPGAFVIPIQNLKDFAPAIRRKLILEIATNQSPSAAPQFQPVQLNVGPAVDCLAGERARVQGLPP